jgi:hypothetical protein
MSMRRITAPLALLALAAASPAVQGAGGANHAVNACAAAFVDLQSSDRAVVVRKINPAPSPLDAVARRNHYTVDLKARDGSGKRIAQAVCITSLRGEVIKLEDVSTGIQ